MSQAAALPDIETREDCERLVRAFYAKAFADPLIGYLFVDGFQRTFPTPILAGITLVALLALAPDLLLVAARRVLAPWAKGAAR